MGKRSGAHVARETQTRPAGASPAPEPVAADEAAVIEQRAVAGPAAGASAAVGRPAVGSLSRVALPDAIRVVDEERREIEVCATSEAVDSYGTVFGYDASRAAFERWIGNVREMHERKAVGSKVAVRYDDDTRRVYARVRISRGAEDTWQKILDGTLRGASIGAANVVWHDAVRSPAEGAPAVAVPVATSYDLVELSLVDNPSNPDALGLAVYRDGVPDPDGSLDTLELEGAGALVPVGGGPSVIDERDGQLSVLDVAAEIARAAQARGQAEIAGAAGGDSDASGTPSRLDRKLRGIGAAAGAGAEVVRVPSAVSPAIASGSGLGESYDVDGDHESAADYVSIQSGPTPGAVAAPSPAGSVAHMAHGHHHTGSYDDPSDHRAHVHLDGTSHTHEHLMDHDHGDHSGFPGGHAHPHVHVPAHSHYYRVADGVPIDARLVSAEDVRTFAVVSGPSFAAAGGTEGKGFTADQMRVAMAAELSAIAGSVQGQQPQPRASGPYSRDPHGPADAGTPANAAPGVVPTEQLISAGAVSTGQASMLDRDGQPLAAGTGAEAPMAPGDADVATPDGDGGVHDASNPPADGWTGRLSEADLVRSVAESVSRAIEGLRGQFSAQLTTELTRLDGRLARIEAQPMPASVGPVLRAGAVEKGSVLGGGSASGATSQADRIRALESLAGRLVDPQAQVAVAAEMIRLQQEGAGMAPAFQVMPRAGNGPVGGVGNR